MLDRRISLVLRSISAYFDVPVKVLVDYKGFDNTRILHRQMAIYLCWKLFNYQNAFLMSVFKIRDESVLQYSINKIEALRSEDLGSGLDDSLIYLSSLILELDEIGRRV